MPSSSSTAPSHYRTISRRRAFVVASSPRSLKPDLHRPQPGDLVIAADGGANLCDAWGWPVDAVVGDMDWSTSCGRKLQAAGFPSIATRSRRTKQTWRSPCIWRSIGCKRHTDRRRGGRTDRSHPGQFGPAGFARTRPGADLHRRWRPDDLARARPVDGRWPARRHPVAALFRRRCLRRDRDRRPLAAGRGRPAAGAVAEHQQPIGASHVEIGVRAAHSSPSTSAPVRSNKQRRNAHAN